MIKILLLIIISVFNISCQKDKDIKTEINKIIEDKNLNIGFALGDLQTGEIVEINGEDCFPMQSVYKFPIATAMLDCVSKGEFKLEDSITINENQLYLDIWSPLSKQYPAGFTLPWSIILDYMITQSDNLATDIIIYKIGGTERVQSIIDGLGAEDINVLNTEKQLQADNLLQYKNCAAPISIIKFLEKFNNNNLLFDNYTSYLYNIMINTKTGSIKKYLSPVVAVAHKTGYSGMSDEGIIAAQNDIGIMELPNGRRVAYAIFINNSKETTDTGYDIIGLIGKSIYEIYK